MYSISKTKMGPCNQSQIVWAKPKIRISSAQPMPHTLTTDHSSDPYCACRPDHPSLNRKCFDLKLKLLQDCYKGRLSDKYQDRRRTFYKRWQGNLDNLPRYPNYDYKVYCCDDYVDRSVNKDFTKYSSFKPTQIGERERGRRNFIWPEMLFQTQEQLEYMRDSTKPLDTCSCSSQNICDCSRQGNYYAEAKVNVYHNEPFTIWHEKVLGPRRHVEGSTLCKSRIIPFHRDASFSTPLL